MPRKLAGFITLDTETTIKVHLKRKASPFTMDNWIVAAAYKAVGTGVNDGHVRGEYFGFDQLGSRGWLKRLLETHNPQLLVGFNIKFDMLWLLRYAEDYEAYQQWIVDGGQLWDSQLVEYLLDGMVEDSHMLSLDETTLRYGGELKIDEVKAYWERGVSTEHIPQQLLMDYLAGRPARGDQPARPGDIENTEIVFLGQIKTTRKRGSMNSMRLNNGALVAIIEMERNGLHVDMKIAEVERQRLMVEIAKMEKELEQYLPKDLPFEFNWGSPNQKSAIFFGGDIKYVQRVPVVDLASGRQEFVKKEETHFVLADGSTMLADEAWGAKLEELKALGVVFNKSGKMAGQPKTKKVKVDDYDKPKFRNEDFLYHLPGYIKPQARWRSAADPNVYSTAKEVIEELEDEDIPFIQTFVKLSKMKKDLSTYYMVEKLDKDGNVKERTGMLTLVGPDGIVHHTVNQTSTVTGRLSHTNPNSGNLPREGTSDVKKNFTSRWGEDGEIISSDFRSLEVYCQAVLSGDKQLILDLQANIDMHVMRLSLVEGRPYEELLILAKGSKKLQIEADIVWERKRTDIKRFSFQRAYGAGAAKIAKMVKRPKEVVEEWIVADDERYSGIPRFNEALASAVARNSVPSKVTVKHPTAKIPLHLNRGYFTTFDGMRYSWLESPAPDFLVKKGVYQSFKPTELKNYPVQGLGGQWMKAAMWITVRVFYAYKNFGGLALLNNTVHDAEYADTHKSVRRKAGIAVHASMLAASDLMEHLFGKEIKVPVPSETTIGPSQFEQHDFEDTAAFEEQAEKVRVWIRNRFMGGYVPSFTKGE